MKVHLRELKPNPVRDFVVDPLDEAIIERLRGSIREHGFWGGVVGRQRNGHIEIGAGHHRIEAAIREGVEEGEVHVMFEVNDRAMIRLYAEENATQRGSAHSTARAGSVAAALRQAAYDVLTGNVGGIPPTSDHSRQIVTGQIATERGLGSETVFRYLAGVPGININTVKEDLSSLKKSGEYARIITEVRDRIVRECEQAERESEEARIASEESPDRPVAEDQSTAEGDACQRQEEAASARQAVERAEKAAAKAVESAPTFDFKGVAAHLKVAHHLQSFRDVVTREEVQACLPMDMQALVAERIVKLAEETDQELTGLFIRSNVVGVVMQIRDHQRRLQAEEKERLLEADWTHRFADLQNHYLGALRNVIHYGERLLKHRESDLKQVARPVPSGYDLTVTRAKQIIESIEEGL